MSGNFIDLWVLDEEEVVPGKKIDLKAKQDESGNEENNTHVTNSNPVYYNCFL